MNPLIENVDKQIDDILPRLTNGLAQLMLEIRTHHRHNEKLPLLCDVVAALELNTQTVEMLAKLNRVPASLTPGGSGTDGGSS